MTDIPGTERADLSRGPGGTTGSPDASALRRALANATTCDRCRRRPATVLRGAPGHYVASCALCAADEARTDRLRRAETR